MIQNGPNSRRFAVSYGLSEFGRTMAMRSAGSVELPVISCPATRLQHPVPERRIDALDSGRYLGRLERLKGLALSGTALGTVTGG